MGSCIQYDEMISVLLDGELTREQEAELRAHLEACPSCQRIYEAFSGLSEAIGGELAAPPESLVQGIMFKLSIDAQRKKPKRAHIGSFTAIAACLALILIGASRVGLMDSLNLGLGKSAAPEAAMMTGETMDAPPPEQPMSDMDLPTAAPEQDSGSQTLKEATLQETEATEPPVEEQEELGFVQYGFKIQSLNNVHMSAEAGEVREPAFLFEAPELRLYSGKYLATETAAEKNKLLLTLSTEEEKAVVYALVTALPDSSVTYSVEDAANLKADPAYTIFVPASTAAGRNEKNKLISIWIMDKEVWCIISDADGQGTETERIIYKAEGALSQFEELVSRLKTAS